MTPPVWLAFKAYEIEELADVYFFRPAGWIVAVFARALRLTPNAVSVLAGLTGGVGGAMLFWPSLGLPAFAVLILHGIIDSADGQLARLTGRASPLGRALDGVAGLAAYVAIFMAIILGTVSRGGSRSILFFAILAGVCGAAHALMYEYHRTTYVNVAVKGVSGDDGDAVRSEGGHNTFLRLYETCQRAIAGLHPAVERAVAARSPGGRVGDALRGRYRACFYRLVRGWNLFGDNTRFLAIGVLAWMDRLDLFFAFILLPMNAAFALVWLWQLAADRRFLDESRKGNGPLAAGA